MQITTITAEGAEITDPEVTQDSEQRSLPLQGPKIESTCTLFTPDDIDDNVLEENNIMEIIGSCLKDAKWNNKNNTRYTIKLLSQLIAVSEYVKLCAWYQKSACKWPCLSASIAIAHQMGKGPYFARQI